MGDGHEVIVAPSCYACENAQAGEGAGIGQGSPGAIGGRGGDAASVSEGIAFGDSLVTVEDRAEAGAGGFGNGTTGAPGDGGAAHSTATGVGSGISAVVVSAEAAGGRGGAFEPYFNAPTGPNARGGDASAISSARGLGEVQSHATARMGSVGGEFLGVVGNASGAASARAIATGASGEAGASALAAGFELLQLRAVTTATVHTQATVEARSAVNVHVERAVLGAVDTFAIAAGRPGQADVLERIGGTSRVADAFSGGAVETVLSLGQVGFTNLQDTNGALAMQHAGFEIAANVLEVSVSQDVMVGFMNPALLGSGFDTLRFRANLRNETLVDVTFEDLDAALAWFDDRVLDLGNFTIGESPLFGFGSPLELILDWTGSEPGAGFGVDLLVGLTPVPEPSTLSARRAWPRRSRGARAPVRGCRDMIAR